MRYVIASALLLLASACGGGGQMTVKGSLTLSTYDGMNWLSGGEPGEGQPCEGMDGYDDIHEGTTVVVRDSKGQRVGLGQLAAGRGTSDDECRFRFTVTDVDKGSGSIYSVEISHRGEQSFKEAEAGSLALSLGS